MQELNRLRTNCLLFFILTWMLVVPSCALCAGLNVALVLSNDSAPYHAFSASFLSKSPAAVHVTVYDTPAAYLASHEPADLAVPVGMLATESLLSASKIPVLSAMVPQTSFEALLKQLPAHHAPVSAVFLSQPWDRQVDFLFAALPGRHRVGILHTAKTRAEMRAIGSGVRRHGGMLVALELTAEDDLAKRLDELLYGCDVLLAIPDGDIYSSSNIRNILLSTYRHSIPMLGWSQAFVYAGAVAAIYATPEQVALQTVNAIMELRLTGALPDAQFPKQFDIAVNRQVSRSLGVVIPDDELIRARMMKGKYRDDD